jgi:glyoxylase-like metal-dependent hydrolase (beta-lactamase superfamily II)
VSADAAPLPGGLDVVDVRHLGNPEVIAAGIVRQAAGIAIVDPGPASSLPHLLEALQQRGIASADIRYLLLTHIHLDHAGATGSLLRLNPRIVVYVSERGAPHLVDPARLLASARRLYGDDMERLWGEVLPVPAGNLRPLAGGERLALDGVDLEVAYTPGHASHHVSYLHVASGTAFVGDVAGIRISGHDYIFPPTPPPDIDLELWSASLDRVARWQPARLLLTHFAMSGGVERHLAAMRERLTYWAEWVRARLGPGGNEDALAGAFTAAVGADVRRHFDEAAARRFEQAVGVRYCWAGLARYWRKRQERQ